MKIDLDEILIGMPGLSHFKAGLLLESCVVTLQRQNHKSGNHFKLSGDFSHLLELNWSIIVNDQLEKTYLDQQEATEHAAECIGILLCLKLSGYTVIERSVKGTGIDYWLGNENTFLFQRKARLEVSGIFDGNETITEARFKKKKEQTTASYGSKLPAIVAVTSFKEPLTKYGKV